MFKYFKKFPYCKSFDTLSDLSNTDIDRLMLSASLDITSTTDIGPTRKLRHSVTLIIESDAIHDPHRECPRNPLPPQQPPPPLTLAATGGSGGGDDDDSGPSGPTGEERQGQHLHQCTTGE